MELRRINLNFFNSIKIFLLPANYQPFCSLTLSSTEATLSEWIECACDDESTMLNEEHSRQVYESSRVGMSNCFTLHIINYVNDAADDARMKMVAVMVTRWRGWIPDGAVVNISSLCTFVFWDMVIVSQIFVRRLSSLQVHGEGASWVRGSAKLLEL